jgi:hypothetical protein
VLIVRSPSAYTLLRAGVSRGFPLDSLGKTLGVVLDDGVVELREGLQRRGRHRAAGRSS